ncbi:adeC/adeK/oprM family multidrug efflux complex outer membrane factor [Desulfoluna limicola]|uniref:AdeC/adeK/oprM family multidrug efflux complex outer membrane factor n=1 Tax=Desulfoluna limicola TaxID=2810562 RepID=A0ABM7PDY2_9BACT|nr:efflux transporter outer membrane subunit [Desulfoluna limicola]BCS95293.1 adeC/adeK/oprM family multidrug efflux complex outer membrane factor [Desulfoluna limicola]
MKRLASMVVACVLMISGCSLAPTYKRPEHVTASDWSTIQGEAKAESVKTDQELATDIPWKTFFQSEELQTVVQTALSNNRDLKSAVLSVQKTQALYNIERAKLLPELTAAGSGNYQSDFHGNAGETYQAGLAMPYYEIDFFGRIDSLSDVALNTYLATDEARKSITISLIAQAANAWLQLTGDLQTLALSEESLATRQQTYDLVNKSFENGVATGQDLSQARIALESARVNTILFTRLVQLDKNALVAILGTKGLDGIPMATELEVAAVMEEIPVGLSSEVLLKRPDILGAEYSLKAAGANIGAARAAFYPRIALTGTLGYSSSDLGNLFNSDNAGWGIGPSISIPIFNGGRNKALLKAAKIDQKIAVVQYEKTLQLAFREVADALASRETLGQQLEAQRMLVQASQDAYDLSMKRYNEGVDAFLSVLDAQRSLFASQTAEIDLQRQELANRVSLYKVLGGGLAQ